MTDLTAADLRSANIRGALLFGADLSTAQLESADLTAICFDEGTEWHQGFDPQVHGAYYVSEPAPQPPSNGL